MDDLAQVFPLSLFLDLSSFPSLLLLYDFNEGIDPVLIQAIHEECFFTQK